MHLESVGNWFHKRSRIDWKAVFTKKKCQKILPFHNRESVLLNKYLIFLTLPPGSILNLK